MRRAILGSVIAASVALGGMTFAPAVFAQAPAGATAQCKDGTYSTAKTKQGACSKHGGVGTWLAGEASESAAKTPTAPAKESPAPVQPKSDAKTTTTEAPPAGAPANATAQCNDGTFSFAKHHNGACSGHKGVKTFFK